MGFQRGIADRIVQTVDRRFDRVALAADRYDRRFLLALSATLAFTLVTYWSIWRYWDLRWFASEDGLTEWWSVATYVASAGMIALTGRHLKRLGHPRLGSFNYALAGGLLLAAAEEISWGQRLLGWSTPGTFAAINIQNETTLHNISEVDRLANTIFFIAALLSLLGGFARVVLHRRGRVTTADFILPSLVLAPALAVILAWKAGGPLFLTLMDQVDLRPQGGEIPEVLVGLCILLFAFANLRRSTALRRAAAYASHDAPAAAD
jgi:hypothetical protein